MRISHHAVSAGLMQPFNWTKGAVISQLSNFKSQPLVGKLSTNNSMFQLRTPRIRLSRAEDLRLRLRLPPSRAPWIRLRISSLSYRKLGTRAITSFLIVLSYYSVQTRGIKMGQQKLLQLIKAVAEISKLWRCLHHRVPEYADLLNLHLDRVALWCS